MAPLKNPRGKTVENPIDLTSDGELEPVRQTPVRQRDGPMNDYRTLPAPYPKARPASKRGLSFPGPNQEVIALDDDDEAPAVIPGSVPRAGFPGNHTKEQDKASLGNILNPISSDDISSPFYSRHAENQSARAPPSGATSTAVPSADSGLAIRNSSHKVGALAGPPEVAAPIRNSTPSSALPLDSDQPNPAPPDLAKQPMPSRVDSNARTTETREVQRESTSAQETDAHHDSQDNEAREKQALKSMEARRSGPVVPRFESSHSSPKTKTSLSPPKTIPKQVARKTTTPLEHARPSINARPSVRVDMPARRRPDVSTARPGLVLRASPSKIQTQKSLLANDHRDRGSLEQSPQQRARSEGDSAKSAIISDAETSEAQRSNSAHNSGPTPSSTNTSGKDFLSKEAIEESLQRHMTEYHENHACAVIHILRYQRTGLARDIMAKKRSGTWTPSFIPTISESHMQADDPFAHMEPIQVISTDLKSTKRKHMEWTVETFSTGRPSAPKTFSAPVTTYKSTAVTVPAFHEYVHLRNNVLTENNRKLLYWPYFADNQDYDSTKKDLWTELKNVFEMTNDDRPLYTQRRQQCLVLSPYIEAHLKEVGLNWDDILLWYLAREDKIKSVALSRTENTELESLLIARRARHEKDFDREKEKWRAISARLPTPTLRKLQLSALVCTAFFDHHGFALWHLARQSEVARAHILTLIQDSKLVRPKGSEFRFSDQTCGICHEYNCLFHGEIREYPDNHEEIARLAAETANSGSDHEGGSDNSDTASSQPWLSKKPVEPAQSSSDSNDSSSESDVDSDIEKVINYRQPITVSRELSHQQEQVARQKFNINYWASESTMAHNLAERRPFQPCKHKGSCVDARCRCFLERVPCEKTCSCPATCNRRYPGCSCAKDGDRVCLSPKCECRLLSRECDADLCGTCGATEVLDPNNRYDEKVVKNKCCNVGIQKNLPKKTLLGHSELHGFGLYLGEDVKAKDFLGEYKGEIITNEEADRRGTIYTHLKTCYLFTLSQGQEVDSTRAGNKMRFINHASPPYANCVAHLFFCNTVTRIGLFALYDLKAGTELFFDYGYKQEFTKGFKHPRQKYGPPAKRPVKTGKGVAVPIIKSVAKGGAPRLRRQLSTPERQMQTAKAREAKAAKRAGLSDSTSPQRGTQKAKKSVGFHALKRSPHSRAHLDIPEGLNSEEQIQYLASKQVADEEEDHTFTVGGANAVGSSSSQNQTSQNFVLDTDEEDEQSVIDDGDKSKDPYAVPLSQRDESSDDENEGPVSTRRGARLRNSLGDIGERRRKRRKAARAAQKALDALPAIVKSPQKQKATRREASRKRKRVTQQGDENSE